MSPKSTDNSQAVSPDSAGYVLRKLGDSVISVRFVQAVERANLHASIFDMSAFGRDEPRAIGSSMRQAR